MVRIVILITVICLAMFCNTMEPQPVLEESTFFNGTVNDQSYQGDGLVFITEDSTFHVRGFLGNSGSHYQVDIILPDCRRGSYMLNSEVQSANASLITGMDGVGPRYSPTSTGSNFIRIDMEEDAGCISGDLTFTGSDNSGDHLISIESTFYIKVGESGKRWTCDFTSDGITHCRFLE